MVDPFFGGGEVDRLNLRVESDQNMGQFWFLAIYSAWFLALYRSLLGDFFQKEPYEVSVVCFGWDEFGE